MGFKKLNCKIKMFVSQKIFIFIGDRKSLQGVPPKMYTHLAVESSIDVLFFSDLIHWSE